MVTIVHDSLWFCVCCTLAAVNGDTCDCDRDGKHDRDTVRGMDRLSERGHISANFDSNADADENEDSDPNADDGIREFSARPCDCCNSRLAGSRHRFAILA